MFRRIENAKLILLSITRTGWRFAWFTREWEFGFHILDYRNLFRLELDLERKELRWQIGHGRFRTWNYLDWLCGREERDDRDLESSSTHVPTDRGGFSVRKAEVIFIRKRWVKPRVEYQGYRLIHAPEEQYYRGVIEADSPEAAVRAFIADYDCMEKLIRKTVLRMAIDWTAEREDLCPPMRSKSE